MISFYEKPACLNQKEDANVIDASSILSLCCANAFSRTKCGFYSKEEAYIRAFHFETNDLLNHYTFSFEEICLR